MPTLAPRIPKTMVKISCRLRPEELLEESVVVGSGVCPDVSVGARTIGEDVGDKVDANDDVKEDVGDVRAGRWASISVYPQSGESSSAVAGRTSSSMQGHSLFGAALDVCTGLLPLPVLVTTLVMETVLGDGTMSTVV
jgi:hypothetical protein